MLSINQLIKDAYEDITRVKGRDYSPNVHEIQLWIDGYLALVSHILSKKTIRICTTKNN